MSDDKKVQEHEQARVECEVCARDFKNRRNLLDHKRRFHKKPVDDDRRPKCDHCAKRFATRQSRHEHMKNQTCLRHKKMPVVAAAVVSAEKVVKIETEILLEIRELKQKVESLMDSKKEAAATVINTNELCEKNATIASLQEQMKDLTSFSSSSSSSYVPDLLWTDDFSSSYEPDLLWTDDFSLHKSPPLVKKKAPISHLMKRRVWSAHVGMHLGETKCFCCNLSNITQLSFHCGHIVSENKGGKLELNNLLPICQSCNSSMGTKNMLEYKAKHGLINK